MNIQKIAFILKALFLFVLGLGMIFLFSYVHLKIGYALGIGKPYLYLGVVCIVGLVISGLASLFLQPK